jgi:hypothetical protein
MTDVMPQTDLWEREGDVAKLKAALDARVREETLLEWVPLSQMFADPGYTRPISRAHCARLQSNFTMKAVGAVYLSLRETGQYAILDGNHRVAAARAAQIAELPAQVFLYLSYQEEAALYAQFGVVKKQSPADRFRARIEMGERVALEIAGLLARHGLEVGYKGGDPGKVRAVASLDRIYLQHGPAVLDGTLGTIKAVWGGDPQAYTSWSLDGLAAFWFRYHAHGRFKIRRLCKRLHETGIKALNHRALMIKGALSSVTALRGAWGRAVWDIYNAGLKRDARLPEWSDHVMSDVGRERARQSRQQKAQERRARRGAH